MVKVWSEGKSDVCWRELMVWHTGVREVVSSIQMEGLSLDRNTGLSVYDSVSTSLPAHGCLSHTYIVSNETILFQLLLGGMC